MKKTATSGGTKQTETSQRAKRTRSSQRGNAAERLEALIRHGTEVFIRSGGYRRTKMSDVARSMNVASGTIFQYVESKEALFDLLLRSADAGAAPEELPSLPIPTPEPGETLEYVRRRIEEQRRLPALEAAVNRGSRAAGAGQSGLEEELAEIVGEIYDLLSRNRYSIKLVERSALDYPELAALWFAGARLTVLEMLERYLKSAVEAKAVGPIEDVSLAARMILETCTLWGVHRHWDPQPIDYDEAAVRPMVIDFVLGRWLKTRGAKGERE